MVRALTLVFLLLGGTAAVLANPFGAVVPSEPVPGFGFSSLIAWTASAQSAFYDGLTSALRQVATSPAALTALLGLSFAYGVVHAAGPGHGKVVIGSYMLASGETARRGALLAIGAAMVQATVAVLLVGLLAGLFNLSRAALSSTTITLERFSYVLVVMLGLYLLYRALRRVLVSQPAPLAMATAAPASTGHHHGPDCGCDHAHMPDADHVQQARGFGQTVLLILGAGGRPCTGALLVLVLALSQGLFWAGSAAAYAMGLGTALTVGVLAVLAGELSRFLSRHGAGAGSGSRALAFVPHAISFAGAVLIVGFGLLLLAASLTR